MNIIDSQLARMRERYPDAIARVLASGTWLLTVPTVRLENGWNRGATSVRFLIPANYPYAALDCFWAENDLRLANGQIPQASQANNQIPETGEMGLWFSWHLTQPWNPNRDTLSSWINTIQDRLRRLQ